MAEPRNPKLAVVKGGLNAVKRLMRDRDEPLSKIDEVLSSKQAPMTTPSGTGLPLMPRDQGMYTVREQKDLPRMPKVDAARAAGKSPKYTERMQDLLDSPTARKKVDKLINQGKDLNMTEWYGTEPLRQVAMDAGRTPEQFESLMAQLASASQRNPVDKQNQMGSYLYHLSETGQLPANSLLLTNKLKKALKEDPTLAEGRQLVELPPGYGSLAQGDIFNRAVMIGQGDIAGALPPNKKLGTFYENLLGNLKPVTVDVNAVRGPIIERGDPRWLTSKLVEKDEEGRIINSYKPREMYNSGEMSMREAQQRPGFWEAAPSGSEYAGFEDLWQRGAKRHGVEPAEAQALGWYGSADVTALKTKPENYVDNLERLIKRTAEQTGQSPTKIMNDLVTGEGFLRKDGGAVDIKAADARLAAAMGQRMAKGGKVDIKAADARLRAAMGQRMASGGGAFKKIQFMAGGGSVQDSLKEIENYSVLDQGAPKQYGLSGVVLAGDSWLSGDDKTKLANQAFGQNVTNTAIGGQKTTDVLRQLNEYESQGGNFAPNTTVVLDIGGNDLATGIDRDTVRNNIDEIVSRLGARGVNVILSGAPSINSYEQAISSTSLAMDDLYNDVARNNPNVTVVDAVSGLLNQKVLMDDSGFHLRDDDSKLQFLNQLAGAYTGADNQGVVNIPQEIAEITQTSQPAIAESAPVRSAGYNAAMNGDGLETYYQNINNYLAQPRTQEEIQDAMQFYSVSQDDIDAARGSLDTGVMDVPASAEPTPSYAEGGSAFKTIPWNKFQRFDGGGIAMSDVSDYEAKPFTETKKWSDIKKNAAEMYEESKRGLANDYERLKNSPRARAQLAKIAAAQLAGGAPDLAHLGVDLVLDPLKSVTIDKLFTKPAYRSVLAGPVNPNSPRLEDQPQREPMFGSLSDALKTEDGLPIGGSEHMIKRAQDAGLMSQGRFSPLTEIPAAIVGGLGASKLSKGVVKGYDKLTGANSGKLNPLQPEAKTASTGTPQGATYATKQEGPFYRVSPTSLDVSGAKSRGLRETDELQGQAPVGGSTGQAGSQVPLRISDEEVARLISDPASNQPLQIAQRFTKDTQGTDFAKPDIPESSLAKQSAIGRAHQLAVEGSPEYKSSVFDAYAKQMPDVLEQAGAKNYDDLMEKAYRQLAKETDEQFKQLPYNFSYHRAGEGDYLGGSKEMMADVHGNKHLYVFQGGDPHDFLNRVDKATGLNENEKFRAVHDLLGHAIYGNQFGPKGEEVAWAIHQQMYSPLARLAMTAETRGQNSLVNYSPLNVSLKTNIAKLEDLEVEAKRRGDTALVNEIRAAKRQEFANNFQFAPQKAVLLPPEFIDPKFAGGLPDYLSAANRPVKGTETQSVLTHYSHNPDLQMLDPARYGTGIKGAEAERLRDFAGGVKDRSYVYLGEPGTISPESGLGVNRYRGESQNLYDITKDPLSFRALARESNRTPFTAKVNAGITSPLQEANDYERLVKEYGYEGMINPNASKPMGIMFKPTPVQPRKSGGLTQLRAR